MTTNYRAMCKFNKNMTKKEQPATRQAVACWAEQPHTVRSSFAPHRAFYSVIGMVFWSMRAAVTDSVGRKRRLCASARYSYSMLISTGASSVSP